MLPHDGLLPSGMEKAGIFPAFLSEPFMNETSWMRQLARSLYQRLESSISRFRRATILCGSDR